MKKTWTEDMLNLSIELIKQGKSYQEISITLNKTIKSIKCKLNRLGIKIDDYKIYKKDVIKTCLYCDEKIIGDRKKFCSNSCSAKYNNRKRKKIEYCLSCKNEIMSKNAHRFCSKKCEGLYKTNNLLKKWKNGESGGLVGKNNSLSKHIRDYIIKKYDNKCSRCGWNEINQTTNKVPLQIDHIDGDHLNNKEENLILLCPNCHSLTSTYGILNKGNGRAYRREIRRKNSDLK